MPLVGDAIVEAREAFPDPCGVLPVPNSSQNPGWTVAVSSGGVLGVGTFYVVLTALGQWGETTGSVEIQLTTTSPNQTITVTPPAANLQNPSQVGYRIYVTQLNGSAGSEAVYFSVPLNSSGFLPAFSITNLGVGGAVAGYPPIRNSAWLPDTDGGFVSASTMYRWLNDALQSMSRIGGGIPSVTGISAGAGQAMYRIPGKWIHFTNFWFDGWPLTFGKRGDVFLHNNVMGIPGIVTIEEWSDTTVVQCWPQPNRAGGQTTLSAGIIAGQSGIGVISAAVFGLPMGIFQMFDSTTGITEICSYSQIVGNTLSQCTRGLGGTVASAMSIGSVVNELNIRISGFRQPNVYSVGQSLSSLGLPLGWEVPLSNYLVAQYRRAEQQEEVAQAMEKAFDEDIKVLAKQSRGKSGPVQIGSVTREVYPGGYGGGILIP